MHVYTYMYTPILTYLSIYRSIYMCIYIYTYMYIMYRHMPVNTSSHMQSQSVSVLLVHTNRHICMCVYVYIYMSNEIKKEINCTTTVILCCSPVAIKRPMQASAHTRPLTDLRASAP